MFATPVKEVSRAFLTADNENPGVVADFLEDEGPGLEDEGSGVLADESCSLIWSVGCSLLFCCLVSLDFAVSK